MRVIPLSWKIGAGALVVLALVLAYAGGVTRARKAGYEAAVKDRAARDALAVVRRVEENVLVADKQATINAVLTKVKNEDIARVAAAVATRRVRVGTAICGPARAAGTESAARGDGADSSGRLVRPDVERDIRALKLAVETDLATGRACQQFIRENGLQP